MLLALLMMFSLAQEADPATDTDARVDQLEDRIADLEDAMEERDAELDEGLSLTERLLAVAAQRAGVDPEEARRMADEAAEEHFEQSKAEDELDDVDVETARDVTDTAEVDGA